MQKCIVVSMMKKFLVMQQKALIKDVTNIKLLT